MVRGRIIGANTARRLPHETSPGVREAPHRTISGAPNEIGVQRWHGAPSKSRTKNRFSTYKQHIRCHTGAVVPHYASVPRPHMLSWEPFVRCRPPRSRTLDTRRSCRRESGRSRITALTGGSRISGVEQLSDYEGRSHSNTMICETLRYNTDTMFTTSRVSCPCDAVSLHRDMRGRALDPSYTVSYTHLTLPTIYSV